MLKKSALHRFFQWQLHVKTYIKWVCTSKILNNSRKDSVLEKEFYEAHLESVGTDTLDILPGECNIFNGFPTIQKVPGIKHQSAIKLQDSCKHLAEVRKLLFYRMRLFTSFLLSHSLTLMAISSSFMFLLIQNSKYYVWFSYFFIASTETHVKKAIDLLFCSRIQLQNIPSYNGSLILCGSRYEFVICEAVEKVFQGKLWKTCYFLCVKLPQLISFYF